jgi:hypothetical protein
VARARAFSLKTSAEESELEGGGGGGAGLPPIIPSRRKNTTPSVPNYKSS